MNAIIIEDESVAAKNLQAIIREVAPEVEIIRVIDSVDATVHYFKNHPMPNLIFMDIQLADGESFLIFKEIEITCPVIFTTAYDTYALEAFKVNSIDYLLKPIEPEHVLRALKKLQQLSNSEKTAYSSKVNQTFNAQKNYIKTLLVNFQDKIIPIPVDQIAFFYIEKEKTNVITLNGKEWVIDKTLDTIMAQLNPTYFFRANRQFIIAHQSVKEVVVWFGNRLSVNLLLPTKERIIISKARVATFKKWLIGNF